MLSKKGWRKKGRNNKSEKKGGEGRGRKRETEASKRGRKVQRETDTTERAGGENEKMFQAALSSIPDRDRGRTRLQHSGKRNAKPATRSEVEVSPI